MPLKSDRRRVLCLIRYRSTHPKDYCRFLTCDDGGIVSQDNHQGNEQIENQSLYD